MRSTELIQKAKAEGLTVRPTAQGIVVRSRGVAFIVHPDDTAVRIAAHASTPVSAALAAAVLNIN